MLIHNMRKYKRVYNRKYGICVLVLGLIVSQAGITKIRNAEAEEVKQLQAQKIQQHRLQYEFQVNNKTPSRSSQIYIEKDKTLNIYPERPKYKLNLDERYQDLIWHLCLENDLSYEFVLGTFDYESKFNFKVTNKNSDESIDQGVAQLNSYYTDAYRQYAIEYCNLPKDTVFNPYNPDHGIRAGIGTLVYLRDYWKQKGVSDELMPCFLANSYNLGLSGFQKYIKETGKIEREYSRQVLKRKIKLETTHTL